MRSRPSPMRRSTGEQLGQGRSGARCRSIPGGLSRSPRTSTLAMAASGTPRSEVYGGVVSLGAPRGSSASGRDQVDAGRSRTMRDPPLAAPAPRARIPQAASRAVRDLGRRGLYAGPASASGRSPREGPRGPLKSLPCQERPIDGRGTPGSNSCTVRPRQLRGTTESRASDPRPHYTGQGKCGRGRSTGVAVLPLHGEPSC